MDNIKVDRIRVGYGDKVIIEDLSIDIPMGKTTTIIGPNGCGKSTLLKSIGRILNIKNGGIYLNGKEIHEMPTKELASKMAILPQSPIAPDGITVEELISYGRYPYQKGLGKLKEEDKKIVAWAMRATNLEELKFQTVDSLSGGQRQRVWIAMALAQETEVILLDEPTTYLDMAYQLEVLELLDELNKAHGCTIIMVLHDLNLASKFADYMVAMGAGKIIKAGATEEVMTKTVLKEVYQIEATLVPDPDTGRPICMSYSLLHKNKSKNKNMIQRGA
ncbi:MAG: ABC transporter ATP-binding protein [Anaerocolumna sp.]